MNNKCFNNFYFMQSSSCFFGFEFIFDATK